MRVRVRVCGYCSSNEIIGRKRFVRLLDERAASVVVLQVLLVAKYFTVSRRLEMRGGRRE